MALADTKHHLISGASPASCLLSMGRFMVSRCLEHGLEAEGGTLLRLEEVISA